MTCCAKPSSRGSRNARPRAHGERRNLASPDLLAVCSSAPTDEPRLLNDKATERRDLCNGCETRCLVAVSTANHGLFAARRSIRGDRNARSNVLPRTYEART